MQLREIERSRGRGGRDMGPNGAQRRANVSYADDLDSDVSRDRGEDMEENQMHEAIIASLLEYTSN